MSSLTSHIHSAHKIVKSSSDYKFFNFVSLLLLFLSSPPLIYLCLIQIITEQSFVLYPSERCWKRASNTSQISMWGLCKQQQKIVFFEDSPVTCCRYRHEKRREFYLWGPTSQVKVYTQSPDSAAVRTRASVKIVCSLVRISCQVPYSQGWLSWIFSVYSSTSFVTSNPSFCDIRAGKWCTCPISQLTNIHLIGPARHVTLRSDLSARATRTCGVCLTPIFSPSGFCYAWCVKLWH